jgi:hypothetical protein
VINKTPWILFVAAVAGALFTSDLWHQQHQALIEVRSQIIAGELQPISTMLKENQTLIKELLAEPFTEKDAGILASYLARIRRDGVAKHTDMKQRLDQLAENNTAIVTLIKAYAPQARTAAFKAEADKFRNYAPAWRDRWNSIMELYMAGGNYPSTEIPFPNDFPDAVQVEIATVK